jgi:2-aminoadipate transaminase
MPLEGRLALLRITREHGVLLVENDTYGELRYHGTAVPTIRELDDRREVILLRSFSKIAFPGLRVGWVVGPRPLISRLADAKQWTDLHTDQLSQAVLLRFAESGRLERHKEKMLAAGAVRLEAALDACARCLPEGSSFTRPEGGMNLWISLPEPLDAGDLLEHARRENVAYLPGKHFAVSRFAPGTLRISFAGLPPDQIRAGLATLGKVFSNELRRMETAHRIETAPAMV